MPQWLRRPWWVGVAIMLMGALWIYGSTKLSQFSSIALVGPGVFVTLIGVGLVLSGAVLVFQMVRSPPTLGGRSEEHTSELQSLMRISYAVFCLKKKTNNTNYCPKQPHTQKINRKQ